MKNICTIRQQTDPILRIPSHSIPGITLEIKELIMDMFIVLKFTKGIGLAANQIGHSEALCIINAPEQIPMVLINPKITWYSSETCIMGEGCLSCKKIYKNIRRPNAIRIKYRDLNYQEHTKKLTGILARIAQHEIDHLNGKLIIDYK